LFYTHRSHCFLCFF